MLFAALQRLCSWSVEIVGTNYHIHQYWWNSHHHITMHWRTHTCRSHNRQPFWKCMWMASLLHFSISILVQFGSWSIHHWAQCSHHHISHVLLPLHLHTPFRTRNCQWSLSGSSILSLLCRNYYIHLHSSHSHRHRSPLQNFRLLHSHTAECSHFHHSANRSLPCRIHCTHLR